MQQSEAGGRGPNTAGSAALIKVESLRRRFGKRHVLDGASFCVERAEAVGLVGPNGAGKTTLLMLLMGYLRADSGTIEIFGHVATCGQPPKKVAFVPDRPSFYDFLTPRGYLNLVAQLEEHPTSNSDVLRALNCAGLFRDADRKIGGFSAGMRQRLAWAQAMLVKPDLVLLDEPTSHLDPLGVAELRKFVAETIERGAAVLFSSHNLSEIEKICSRVLFLYDGKIQARADVPKSNYGYFEIVLHAGAVKDLSKLRAHVENLSVSGNHVSFSVFGRPTLNQLVSMLEEWEVRVTSVKECSESLERAFVNQWRKQ